MGRLMAYSCACLLVLLAACAVPGSAARAARTATSLDASDAVAARTPLQADGSSGHRRLAESAAAERDELTAYLQQAAAEYQALRAAGSPPAIPHVLHQVFLDGEEALRAEEQASASQPTQVGQPFPKYNAAWRESCRRHHVGWRHVFWDLAAAEALLAERYAWFLPTFRGYKHNVQRGDALRPFILHAHGGLYLDVDMECFASSEDALAGAEVVLQMEAADPRSLNNAALAGAAGHPFWALMGRLMAARAGTTVASWRKLRPVDGTKTVLATTGPHLLREAFALWAVAELEGPLAAGYAGDHVVNGSRVRVWPYKQWFEPCEWDDYACHAALEAAAHGGGALPPGVVGHHKNSGAWLVALSAAEISAERRFFAKLALGALASLAALAYYVVLPWWRARRAARSMPHRP